MEPGKLMKTWPAVHNESVIQGDSAYDIWPGELHRMSYILDDLDAEKCWKMLKNGIWKFRQSRYAPSPPGPTNPQSAVGCSAMPVTLLEIFSFSDSTL